jgi:hypothetical protein
VSCNYTASSSGEFGSAHFLSSTLARLFAGWSVATVLSSIIYEVLICAITKKQQTMLALPFCRHSFFSISHLLLIGIERRSTKKLASHVMFRTFKFGSTFHNAKKIFIKAEILHIFLSYVRWNGNNLSLSPTPSRYEEKPFNLHEKATTN